MCLKKAGGNAEVGLRLGVTVLQCPGRHMEGLEGWGQGTDRFCSACLMRAPFDFSQMLSLHFKLFLLFIAGNRASADSTSVTLHIPMPRPSESHTYSMLLLPFKHLSQLSRAP